MTTKPAMKERTNLRTLLVALLVFIAGIALLVFSETTQEISSRLWLKAVVTNLGGLVIASVSIALLWELVSKRAFFDELLANTGLVDEIRSLGLVGLSVNALRGPDFSKLIRSTTRLDIFVCYANTWRGTYVEELRELAKKPNFKVRLIVPNPKNQALMTEIAQRFGVGTTQALQDKINGAIDDLKNIFASADQAQSEFSVWVHEDNPVTSFFLFDSTAVVTLYKHSRGRGNVPTFVFDQGGSLFRYVETEVQAMVAGADGHPPLAKRLHP